MQDRIKRSRAHLLAVARQLVDTIKLAPAEFVAYMVTSVWLGVYSAVNLYWLSVLLDRVRRSRHLGE